MRDYMNSMGGMIEESNKVGCKMCFLWCTGCRGKVSLDLVLTNIKTENIVNACHTKAIHRNDRNGRRNSGLKKFKTYSTPFFVYCFLFFSVDQY